MICFFKENTIQNDQLIDFFLNCRIVQFTKKWSHFPQLFNMVLPYPCFGSERAYDKKMIVWWKSSQFKGTGLLCTWKSCNSRSSLNKDAFIPSALFPEGFNEKAFTENGNLMFLFLRMILSESYMLLIKKKREKVNKTGYELV